LRILLCLLSLASVALGQGDPPPDLLAVPLAEREALLTNLDAVVKRIESGMAKVEKHSDEGFKRAAAQDEEGGAGESVTEE
jgi:hypothetical protein